MDNKTKTLRFELGIQKQPQTLNGEINHKESLCLIGFSGIKTRTQKLISRILKTKSRYSIETRNNNT